MTEKLEVVNLRLREQIETLEVASETFFVGSNNLNLLTKRQRVGCSREALGYGRPI